jgi:hypothetical protein
VFNVVCLVTATVVAMAIHSVVMLCVHFLRGLVFSKWKLSILFYWNVLVSIPIRS